MLIKILFTLVVIIVVIVFFRYKQARAVAAEDAKTAEDADDDGVGNSLSPRVLAYGLLSMVVIVSMVVFGLHWRAENRIVDVRVIAEDGVIAHYQTRYKSISGRNFITLSGARITLALSDRIEMSEP